MNTSPTSAAPAPDDRHVLVTGVPHFVARLLVARILEQEPATRLTLLARTDHLELVQAHSAGDPRVDVVAARLVRADLGLPDDTRRALLESVTDVYHLKSLYHLGVDKQRAEDVNIQATRNLLEFGRQAQRLRRFNHYSTAFVAGDRQGIVLEGELDRGQGFRNTFERTKFTAELEVRRAMGELPATIYRPSLVVGSSVTGAIDALDGPYFLLQLLTRTPGRVPLNIPTATGAPFNVVPADYVAQALLALSTRDTGVGRTYHLVDPAPIPTVDALQLVAEYANHGTAPSRVPAWIRGRVLSIRPVGTFARSTKAYLHELDGWTFFNPAGALRDLRQTGILCPSFPEYVQKLVRWSASATRGELGTSAELSGSAAPPLR